MLQCIYIHSTDMGRILSNMNHAAHHREEWDSKYSEYNESNMRTLNVFECAHEHHVYVDKNHPAVDLLRCNKEIVGVNVDQLPLMDGRFLKMSKNIFEACCETIVSQVMTWVTE